MFYLNNMIIWIILNIKFTEQYQDKEYLSMDNKELFYK